jgi:hypothetical protein
MKHSLLWVSLVLFQGCTTANNGVLTQHSSSGSYNPQTIDSVDPNKYKADKQQCYKQVETVTPTSMMEHSNIIKFRDCLVKKGYVLLS